MSEEEPAKEVIARVLIADDDEDFRALLSIFLRKKGFGILEAFDGIEALRVAEIEKPDLILLDVNMPRMDGFQTASELNLRMGAEAPKIIIITGRSLVEEDVAALLSGAAGALHKPFGMEELNKQILKVLRAAPEDSPWKKIQDGTS